MNTHQNLLFHPYWTLDLRGGTLYPIKYDEYHPELTDDYLRLKNGWIFASKEEAEKQILVEEQLSVVEKTISRYWALYQESNCQSVQIVFMRSSGTKPEMCIRICLHTELHNSYSSNSSLPYVESNMVLGIEDYEIFMLIVRNYFQRYNPRIYHWKVISEESIPILTIEPTKESLV